MNLALVYKSKIIEVKDNIEELKAIDFECDNYEEILEKIKKDTSKNIEEAYYKFTNPDYFLPESLNTVYEEAIKKIDILNEQLTKEYEYCYKLTVKSKLLNQKLDNIEDNEIQNIITDIQKLLFQMKKMPTINYDDNQKLIEEIYKLVYRGIKLELASKKDSQLLEKIKIDNTDISYVASLIKKDISNINYDDVKDYLTSDFKEKVIPTKEVEKSTSKPSNEYEESEYVITKQIQDKQDSIITEKLGLWIIMSSLNSTAIFLFNLQFLKIIYKVFDQELSLKQLKQVVRKNKVELMTEKKKLLETKQKIEKLYNQISNLKSSIEVEYEELPIALKENEKIKRKILTIEEDNIEK